MRRVLMFCYYYPPLGGIGSQRSQKFARYLGDYGWQPAVIAPRQGCYFVDPTLDDGSSRGVEITRTGALDLVSLLKRRVANATKGEAVDDAASLRPIEGGAAVRRLRRAVHNWLYIPDGQVGWLPYALRAARRVMAAHAVDAIYSSSFPVTAHLIASRIKRATGKPWVADFRDLWTENHYAEYSSRLRKRIDQRIEARLLDHADIITTVSDEWAETLRRLTGGRKRVEVIRNGFDAGEFDAAERRAPRQWTVAYVGLFYGAKQDPSPFLTALRRLIDGGAIARDAVRFQIVGEPDSYVRDLVARFGLGDVTTFTGFVAHSEAVAHQVNASLLLLIVPNHPASAGQVPGKLYEYIGARRPILALAPPEFEAARLVRQAGAGVAVDASDAAGIEGVLRESYAAFQSGGASSNANDVARFERRHQAGQLAGLLNDIAALPANDGAEHSVAERSAAATT